jgi:hypothetical protein
LKYPEKLDWIKHSSLFYRHFSDEEKEFYNFETKTKTSHIVILIFETQKRKEKENFSV